MSLHLHVPLTKEQLDSDTLSYSVRLTREDTAQGRYDSIEIDGYGVLEELLEALTDSMHKQKWLE